MKLYATTTSERASKGQGGEYLDIDITREGGEFLGSIQIRITKDAYGDIYNATIDFAEYVYVNGKHWLDAEVRDRDYIKGEKKWCHHYKYLPYKEQDLLEDCRYCKENKKGKPKGEKKKGECTHLVTKAIYIDRKLQGYKCQGCGNTVPVNPSFIKRIK